ncbi:hypothetical protein I308_105955 [Cryptococcus tetragattii IND107]|uniref:Uncharacterized protein n=1 Tax=Cryptococcus tetragattii IND107 TaxID=1296105 RepID=A0ABR3BKL1_9TREE
MEDHSGTITPFAHTSATKFRIQNYVYDCIHIFISVIRYILRLSSFLSFPPSLAPPSTTKLQQFRAAKQLITSSATKAISGQCTR